MRSNELYAVAALWLLPSLLACSVKVHKGENGEDKDVEVRMPMGGVHIQQGSPSAADLGLPSYPGAKSIRGKDGDSADVHVGFGDWQMHVRVAEYETGDTQAMVTSFYRKALAQYGAVVACQAGEPVGTPATTQQGLGCREQLDGVGSHVNENESGFSLRAGSRRHQHIVQFEGGGGGVTQFTLLRLDLPGGMEPGDRLE